MNSIATSIPPFKLDDSYSINVEAFPTYHGDLAEGESLGFTITVNEKVKEKERVISRIGYTGDAHWTKGFSAKLENCNIVCAHLGSIVNVLKDEEFCNLCADYKKDIGTNKCVKHTDCKADNFRNGKPDREKLLQQVMSQKHLYLSGLTFLFDDLLKRGNLQVGVISEFGEELKGGIRMDLYHKFDDWFKQLSPNQARCFPGDIGMEIDIINGNVLCNCCKEFRPKEMISPITYGKEEAIFFVCDECSAVLSSYQIGEKLSEYYENGRKLEPKEENREIK
jgi:hypothetical protein